MVMFAVAEHDKKLANIYHFHKRMLTTINDCDPMDIVVELKIHFSAGAFSASSYESYLALQIDISNKTHLLPDEKRIISRFWGVGLKLYCGTNFHSV